MDHVLTARLGRGRTVETFSGVLTTSAGREDVVVKRVRPELVEDRTFTNALLSWGRGQRDLEHKNVVRVLDATAKDGEPFIVQERVNGATLAGVLEQLRTKRRTLRPEFAFSIFRQIVHGLTYVQATLSEPHAGIDPGEVLVGYQGEVKLGDQRIHTLDRLVGPDFAPDATYLAPEVTEGQEATEASDVYAVALVMLEMLIGQPVWTAPSMTVEASIQALRDFSHVGQAQPGLTDDLVTVLGMCVESEVENRIQSAKQLKAELARIKKKNALALDAEALGAFVRALLPKQAADEAPTMLVATHANQGEDMDKRIEIREASVVIDEQLVKKALRRVRESHVAAAPRRARVEVKKADPLDALPGGKKAAWILLCGLGMLALMLLAIVIDRAVSR